MVQHSQDDLSGSRFDQVQLVDSEFERVDLSGAKFRSIDLTGARLHAVVLTDVRLRAGYFSGVEITGELEGVTINGVDVAPLVEAELNRRHPERASMKAADVAGLRDAWRTLERLWDETVARARRLEPESLHESVDGEWSFVQTLRHLLFATDAWIGYSLGGDPSPWHPLDLPWDEMPETPGIPRDRTARPALDDVLTLRAERRATVRDYLDGLSDDDLDRPVGPIDAPWWPRGHVLTVRDCLHVVTGEEWEHRLYAERDLAVLEAR